MTDAVRVLHVDDDPAIAELTATRLELELDDISVVTATSADEALERLAETPVDCIVSDFEMPGTDGLGLLEAVREDRPDLPFILFTGKGSEEVASEAISAGVTDYLQKGTDPSQFTVLANRVANAVDQYRARQTLAANEQRFSLFFEESPMGVIEWDESFNVVRLNPAAEAILGYDADELAGESWEQLVPPDDRDGVDGVVSALLEDVGGRHHVNENVRADGERIVCEWHNRVVTDDEGEVVTIFSKFQDVTDRVNQYHELERYRALVDAATNAIVSVDAEGHIQTANPAVGKVFGYDPADLIGEPVTVLMDEQTAERHMATFCQYLTTGERTLDWNHVELTGRHADGSRIPLVATYSEVTETDEPLYVAVMRDVSDAEAAAERDARQRTLLAAQQEAMPDGILVVDESGMVVSINDRFAELWGLPTDVVEGADEAELLEHASEHVADPVRFRESVASVADDRETIKRDELHLDDGRIFDRYTTPVRGDDGTYYGRLWTFRDISDRVQTEHQLRERVKELEAIRDAVALFDQPVDSLEATFEALVERLPASFRRPEAIAVYVECDGLTVAGDGYDEAAPTIEATTATAAGEQLRLAVSYDAPAGTDPAEVFLDEEVNLLETLAALFREHVSRERFVTRLAEEKRRYETILKQSTDYVITVDRTGTITYASPSIEAVMGFAPDEVVGSSAFQYIHDADRKVATAAMEQAFASPDEVITAEWRTRTAAGDHRWIEARGQNALDDPILEGILVNARDITERRTHERELELLHDAANELYTADSIEACHAITIEAGVSILGFDWCTLTAPAEGTDQFEIVAVSKGAPVDVGDRPFGIDEGIAGQVFQSKEPSIVDDIGEAPHGRPTRADIRSALTIPAGDWGVFQAVSTDPAAFDAADRRQAELLVSAMQTAIKRIEHEVELQRRNQRLEEFTSVVSHDLRSPLSVAAGRIELAAETGDHSHLEEATVALDRMEQLIGDLLSLAEKGERVGAVEPVSLSMVVTDAWRSVATASAVLEVHCDQSVLADRSRLAQLVENLVRNAVDYGGSEVTVTVDDLEDGFFVEDDGPGIAPDERTAVFEAGYSSSADGTGFGLAIVKDIAEAHGWAVAVTEGAAGGARFEITGVTVAE